ncbi:MAG TPA: carboxypeptidase regulatory-like domain-containing protein [Candidatus Acidoferrales bacterium]|nr:carboxypeptidase regulatory-like domain-containing protein [Candidatus Acidoferrales bacterium]
MKTTTALLFSFLLSVVPLAAQAATIHGTTDAAVLWISAPKALPKPIEGVLTNHDRSFIPEYIVIPAGSTVRFPNEDPFFHSIYSTSPADPFDIGFYDTGPGKTVPFPNPGIIEVHCHIHASMHATIVVTDGPYAQSANGSYAITGVPAGKYVLHAWDPGSGERTQTVDVPSDSADLTIDIRR